MICWVDLTETYLCAQCHPPLIIISIHIIKSTWEVVSEMQNLSIRVEFYTLSLQKIYSIRK